MNCFPQSTVQALEVSKLTAQVFFSPVAIKTPYRSCVRRNRQSHSQTPRRLSVPVAGAALSLDVLQVELGPGVWHGFGLLDGMFPRVLSGQRGQKC